MMWPAVGHLHPAEFISIGKSNGLFHRRRAPVLLPTLYHRYHSQARETGANACERAGRCQGKGGGTRAAAGPAGERLTQDGHVSLPLGPVGRTLRVKVRRRQHGPSLAEPSEMGPLHTRRGQAEEHAKVSCRYWPLACPHPAGVTSG